MKITRKMNIFYLSSFLSSVLFYFFSFSALAQMATIESLYSGDLNQDGYVDIADSIIGIQILNSSQGSRDALPKFEVNGDDKFGLQEVIYIMQVIGNLRDYATIHLSNPVNISNTPGIYSQASDIHIDENGVAHIVWEERGGWYIGYSRSIDGCKTFSEPRWIAEFDMEYHSQYNTVHCFNGIVHITGTLFNVLAGGAEVIYMQSTDNGNNFSEPQIISSNDGINSLYPTLSVNDILTIIWKNSNIGSINYTSFRISQNAGIDFSPEYLINLSTGPVIGTFGDNIYIAFFYNQQNEIYFTRSLDRGKTFSDPIQISINSELIGSPQMSIDDKGNIYVLWSDARYYDPNEILFVTSKDNGASFNNPKNISGPIDSLSRPRIISNGDGEVIALWILLDDYYKGRLFMTTSLDGGLHFTLPTEIIGFPEDTGGLEADIIAHNKIGVTYGIHSDNAAPDIIYNSIEIIQ